MAEGMEETSGVVSSQAQTELPAHQTDVAKAYKNPTYRYLVLGILTAVYVSNFVDRQVINVLAEFIIADLEISDGQFGMLSGLAFALIYSTLGIPIARWADTPAAPEPAGRKRHPASSKFAGQVPCIRRQLQARSRF